MQLSFTLGSKMTSLHVPKKKKKKLLLLKKKKHKNMTKKSPFLLTINNSNGCLYLILNTCVLYYILILRSTILTEKQT